MDELHRGNISFLRAFRLLSDLYNSGIRHIVISPGSRSTPLALAASSHPGLRKLVHIDERSAAFLALGIGKSTGIPAALICTSGTAVANYYPAVIEARMTATPLIVLSADRPPKDRITGTPQTINQIRIFGNYPVYFTDAPLPAPDKRNEDEFRLIASHAWSAAMSSGPAHINLPFDKPLEPEAEYVERTIKRLQAETDSSDNTDGQNEEFHPAVSNKPTVTSPGHPILNSLKASRRPLLILGPTNHHRNILHDAVSAFTKAGVPVISTAGSNSKSSGICGYDTFLRHINTQDELKPDIILRAGLHPVSIGLELFLEACRDVEHIHFSGHDDFNDALQTVTKSVGIEHIAGLSASLTQIDPGWLPAWTDRQDHFLKARKTLLESNGLFTDGHIFNLLPEVVPEKWLITLSNSFPVRDYDLFKPADTCHDTITNRGASGIDGLISTAAGACIGSGRNGILFIGDIAALHDSNGLAFGRFMTEQTLIVVVINNGGGTIFRMLPIAGEGVTLHGTAWQDIADQGITGQHHADQRISGHSNAGRIVSAQRDTDRDIEGRRVSGQIDSGRGAADQEYVYTTYFETPQNIDFRALAGAHQIGYERVNSRGGIASAFRRVAGRPGLHLIECMTDADASMDIRIKLWKNT